MHTTVYKCDRCKMVVRGNDLQVVSINIGGYVAHTFKDENDKGVALSAEWCDRCLKELGLQRRPPKEKEIVPPPPVTIESLIYEIVYRACEEMRQG